MIENRSVAILIVGYLGVPKTAGFIACDEDKRFFYTKDGIHRLCNISERPVYVAITGDYSQFTKIEYECQELKCEFSYFEQDEAKFKLGSGALEVDAIKNAINRFKLEDFDKIIKITAKYYVENLPLVEKFIANDPSLIRAWLGSDRGKCDTRLFAFSPIFFIRNYKKLANVTRTEWLETRVYESVQSFGVESYYFYKRPLLVGFSGTTGVRDELSLIKKILVYVFTYLGVKY